MDELKQLIRALVISNAQGMTVAQLDKDFRTYEGYSIPHHIYGFQSLDAMLRTMSDTVRTNGYGPTALVQPIITQKTEHVREMVQKSKKSKNVSQNRMPPKFAPKQIPYENGYARSSNFSNNYNKPVTGFYYEAFKRANDIILSSSDDSMEYAEEEDGIPEQSIPVKMNADKAVTSPTDSMLVYKIPEHAITYSTILLETQIPSHIKSQTVVKVAVTAILDPSQLHVHLMEHSEKLLKLAPYIDNMYNTKLNATEWKLSNKKAQVDVCCVAKYNNRWHRARVMRSVEENRVLLSFIDYGYLRYVPLDDIRYLTDELAMIPPQTICVGLAHLKPVNGTWTDDCKRYLAKTVRGKVFDMKMVSLGKEKIVEAIFTSTLDSSDNCLNKQLGSRDDIEWTAHPKG